MFELKTWVK